MTKPQNNRGQFSSPRIMKRLIRRRDAIDAAQRIKTSPDGSVNILRFTLAQRIEHMVLILSFSGLAVTGLVQTYYETPIGSLILALFGGINSTRSIHHLFAFVFGAQSLYHVSVFVYQHFVLLQAGRMMPGLDDVENLFKMLALNLGFSKKPPRFDRYNVEEKMVYWILVLGAVIMGITGLMQWFPVQVTDVLSGWVIPVARTAHRWQAILTVITILVWHIYHTIIKTKNFSIFTGLMSLGQMREEHPLELLYLEAAAASIDNQKWPLLLKIPLDEQQNFAETTDTSMERKNGNHSDTPDNITLSENKIPLEMEIETHDDDAKIIV